MTPFAFCSFPAGDPRARLLDIGLPAVFVAAAENGTPCRVNIRDAVIDLDIAAPTPVPWIAGLWIAVVDVFYGRGGLPAQVASMSWGGRVVTAHPTATTTTTAGRPVLRLLHGGAR